jgi:SAM-dependent methyltransferase
MDEPDVDPATLEAALRHVGMVNRFTGARRALLRHLPAALPPDATRILDVGTGSADLPIAVDAWAPETHRHLTIFAADRHRATLNAARRRLGAHARIRLVGADALCLPFRDDDFDLAILSMTLHHLDRSALVGALEELARVARGGRVLVAELERSIPNYLGARLLAGTLWRSNPITRHDGPLSVLRSFTPRELLDLAHLAGLDRPVVHRHPFYRLVLLAGAPETRGTGHARS